MRFQTVEDGIYYQGKKHVLRGNSSSAELKTISGKEMSKLLSYTSECSIIQLCSLQMEDHCCINGMGLVKEEKIPDVVQELLNQYGELFKEPTQLPLHRSHDHKIPLKEGANAVNMRPYRHSSLQKDVVEKMTQELLKAGLIQPSSSSFSSLMVLVKKKDGS